MGRKKKTEESISDIEAYQLRVNYALELLEKRIAQYQKMLSQIEEIIKEAASRKNKIALIEALKAKRQVEKTLQKYLGYYRTLNTLVQQIQESALIKTIASAIIEGKEILKKETLAVRPEAIEAAMAETEEIISSMDEVSDIIAQGFMEEEDVDIEEEAERLIAEATLPQAEEKEKVEEDVITKLRKVLEGGS